jgi:hypothetical protein
VDKTNRETEQQSNTLKRRGTEEMEDCESKMCLNQPHDGAVQAVFPEIPLLTPFLRVSKVLLLAFVRFVFDSCSIRVHSRKFAAKLLSAMICGDLRRKDVASLAEC